MLNQAWALLSVGPCVPTQAAGPRSCPRFYCPRQVREKPQAGSVGSPLSHRLRDFLLRTVKQRLRLTQRLCTGSALKTRKLGTPPIERQMMITYQQLHACGHSQQNTAHTSSPSSIQSQHTIQCRLHGRLCVGQGSSGERHTQSQVIFTSAPQGGGILMPNERVKRSGCKHSAVAGSDLCLPSLATVRHVADTNGCLPPN